MNTADSPIETAPGGDALSGILAAGLPAPGALMRAVVTDIPGSGEVFVSAIGASPEAAFACDVLLHGRRMELRSGDSVLVLAPLASAARGVVLGVIGPYAAASASAVERVTRWEVHAEESLLLTCGEGSLEMRKDGKVLLAGRDVVSHAKRVQRIKGGTVSIN